MRVHSHSPQRASSVWRVWPLVPPQFARAGSVIFLILQLILLIDFIHDTTEYLVDNGSTAARIVLALGTFIAFGLGIAAVSFAFYSYTARYTHTHTRTHTHARTHTHTHTHTDTEPCENTHAHTQSCHVFRSRRTYCTGSHDHPGMRLCVCVCVCVVSSQLHMRLVHILLFMVSCGGYHHGSCVMGSQCQ